MHAVNVFRAGLNPRQDDFDAFSGAFFGLVGGEHQFATGSAGRGGQAGGDHHPLGRRVQGRVQKLVQGGRVDPHHRLRFFDQSFIGHFDGDFDRRLGGAFAGPGLQHPQFAVLNGKLDVLHVAIVAFELFVDAGQLAENLRHERFQRRRIGPCGLAGALGDVVRGANAGDHVFALGVDQIFTVKMVVAGCRVAGEGNPGGAGFAQIAKHHRLNINGGAPIVGNSIQPPIGDGPGIGPRAKHRANRPPELVVHILGERFAQLGLHEFFVLGDDVFPVVTGHFGVQGVAGVGFVFFQEVFEAEHFDPQHHIGVHLNEAAIGIIGKARIVAAGGQPFDRYIVETQIKDGVHHAGHRGAPARADRDQQRVGSIAKHGADRLCDLSHCGKNFVLDAGGQRAAGPVEFAANMGGESKSGGHRQAQIAHFGQVGTLAAKQRLHRGNTIGSPAAKPVDPLGWAVRGDIECVHRGDLLRISALKLTIGTP